MKGRKAALMSLALPFTG